MPQSDDDIEKEDTKSRNHQEVKRRNRTTPRQLWESRRQNGQADEAASKLNVQPIINEEKERSPEPMEGESDEAKHDSTRPQQDEKQPEEETESNMELTDHAGVETESLGEDPGNEGSGKEDLTDADATIGGNASNGSGDHNGDRPEAEMVAEDQQPGAMRYPYATHGPAPDDGESSLSDKIVPSSFVLGILIIVGALLIGLALVAQHSRIVSLEDRVNALESVISEENVTVSPEE